MLTRALLMILLSAVLTSTMSLRQRVTLLRWLLLLAMQSLSLWLLSLVAVHSSLLVRYLMDSSIQRLPLVPELICLGMLMQPFQPTPVGENKFLNGGDQSFSPAPAPTPSVGAPTISGVTPFETSTSVSMSSGVRRRNPLHS